MASRRQFLQRSGAAAMVAIGGDALSAQTGTAAGGPTPAAEPAATPGAPPTFGAADAVGPAVNAETFAEAEKLVQVTNSAAHREQMAGNWQQSMAALYERRTGPHTLALRYTDAPATLWNPGLGPVETSCAVLSSDAAPARVKTVPAKPYGDVDALLVTRALPASDNEIAFATVVELGHWLRTRQITSERLTQLYLARLKKYNAQLECVITLCEEHALAQARAADAELAAGKVRGPLHGIPWGAKDLLDTAGIRTTWGAMPFKDRVPAEDATVTHRLNEAGAVLVAKLSLGALALNDVWFGGETRNPWLLEEGSSGSSAGPAAAVAAGLVGFAIGSETQGSIVSPSMRCGVTGLRPTFGRVPRTGAMTLSWSCDKLGPMARAVTDTDLVLRAIEGPDYDPVTDAGDLACTAPAPLGARGAAKAGLRIGYIDAWMHEAPATDVDRHALEVLRSFAAEHGHQVTAVTIPEWPYGSLNAILFAESAAAFEHITLDGEVDTMRMQVADAWPNTFRRRASSVPLTLCRPTGCGGASRCGCASCSAKSMCC